MLQIIFLSLFFFISNFYTVNIPDQSYKTILASIDGVLKTDENKYIMVYNSLYSSYAFKFEMKYDNITFLDEKRFIGHHDSVMKYISNADNKCIFE